MTKALGGALMEVIVTESKKDGLRKEKARQLARKWYYAHREEAIEKSRKWRSSNLEKAREKSRNWQKNNPERSRENSRTWLRVNPDKKAEYNHRRRDREIGNGGRFTAVEWNELKEKYGNKCLCCGEAAKLTADHVVPVINGGTNNIDNIQPLCLVCNSKKGTKTIDYRISV
jgi:5-methylcytosine-specific restriction endonuclease McrA